MNWNLWQFWSYCMILGLRKGNVNGFNSINGYSVSVGYRVTYKKRNLHMNTFIMYIRFKLHPYGLPPSSFTYFLWAPTFENTFWQHSVLYVFANFILFFFLSCLTCIFFHCFFTGKKMKKLLKDYQDSQSCHTPGNSWKFEILLETPGKTFFPISPGNLLENDRVTRFCDFWVFWSLCCFNEKENGTSKNNV